MTTHERLINIERIARAFSESLRRELGGITMATINAMNAAEPNDQTCASHDFCDANMNMAEGFLAVMGREIDIQNDEQVGLWNDAWDLAKANKFFPEASK